VGLRENVPNSTMQQVPQIDFSNLNFLASMPGIPGTNDFSLFYVYDGPSQIAKQIAMAVAAQNSVLPITAPFPNASWTLDFKGPSLKCNPVSSSESLSFQENIAQYIQQDSNCETPATYMAWFPRFDVAKNQTFNEPYLPMVPGNTSALTFSDPESIFNIGPGDFTETIQSSIMYITIMPNMLKVTQYDLSSSPYACDLQHPQMSNVTSDNPLGVVGGNVTILQCQLYNSTYHTEFNYNNGAQTVNIDLVNQETDTTVPVINLVKGPGSNGLGAGKCATLNENQTVFGSPCDFDGSLLSQLSYQGILQAFTTLILGNITLVPETNGLLDSTSVRSTSLVQTRELYYLSDYAIHAASSSYNPDLQKALFNSSVSAVSGMLGLQKLPSNQSLQDAIETMFRNLTVSFMSSSVLQHVIPYREGIYCIMLIKIYRPNYSSQDTPPGAIVTQFTSQTIYIYAADKLWAAYGTAALVTTLLVIIGFLKIIADGKSYGNSFSTVFRIVQAAKLSVKIQESDLDGKNPLPLYLEKATVVISTREDRGNTSNIEESSVDPKLPNAATALLS
jgi:hypothetical protein